jgi:hypothetical protein
LVELRIVRRPAKIAAAISGQPPAPSEASRTVEFGKEDIVFALIVGILVAGWVTGQLTIEQLLAYLGVSTTGGVWGLIGGFSSD